MNCYSETTLVSSQPLEGYCPTGDHFVCIKPSAEMSATHPPNRSRVLSSHFSTYAFFVPMLVRMAEIMPTMPD